MLFEKSQMIELESKKKMKNKTVYFGIIIVCICVIFIARFGEPHFRSTLLLIAEMVMIDYRLYLFVFRGAGKKRQNNQKKTEPMVKCKFHSLELKITHKN